MDQSITRDSMTAADCFDVLQLADNQVSRNTAVGAKNLLNISLLGRENIEMKARMSYLERSDNLGYKPIFFLNIFLKFNLYNP